MATLTYRLNTSQTSFPFISTMFGRSILQRNREDSNLPLGRPMSELNDDRDIGLPSIIYMHNMMPTSQGFMGVEYKIAQESIGPVLAYIEVTGTLGDKDIIFIQSGKIRVFSSGAMQPYQLIDLDLYSTVATVKGKTAIFSTKHKKLYYYNQFSKLLEEVTPKGLVLHDIIGVTSLGPHLILYSTVTLYRSSVYDLLDFTPSLSNVSGSDLILDQTTHIIRIVENALGLFIYTKSECIAATLTGDTAFPIQYRVLENFEGVRNFYDIEGSIFPNIVTTPSGIFSVGKDVNPTLMDAYEFLSNNILEEYVGDTGEQVLNAAQDWFGPDTTLVNTSSGFVGLLQFRTKFPIKYSVKVIDYRYLCVSYGLGDSNSYNWIIFQDLYMKRWGKLRIPHTHLIQFTPSSLDTGIGIGIITTNGTIVYPTNDCGDFDVGGCCADTDNSPVAIYARLESVRGSYVTLESVTADFVVEPVIELQLLNSINGHTWDSYNYPKLVASYRGHRKWASRITGLGLGFILKGRFNLSTIQVTINSGGVR